jgi:phosphoribosylamine---glycine ligase
LCPTATSTTSTTRSPYVKENPERYVIKPSGAAANVKRRLFVGDEDDGQDVIRVLEAYKKSFPDEIRQFQL